MSFSDEDLKRLKNWIDSEDRYRHQTLEFRDLEEISALLTRLDCAERLITALKNKENVTEEELAWEKSCGL